MRAKSSRTINANGGAAFANELSSVSRFLRREATVASPNYLVQQFKVSEPNEAWVTDIILHLHLMFSRQVIDWSRKPRMCSDLAIDAILMAVCEVTNCGISKI